MTPNDYETLASRIDELEQVITYMIGTISRLSTRNDSSEFSDEANPKGLSFGKCEPSISDLKVKRLVS